MKGYMYILKCADGSYYVGSTKYLELRLAQHQSAGETGTGMAQRKEGSTYKRRTSQIAGIGKSVWEEVAFDLAAFDRLRWRIDGLRQGFGKSGQQTDRLKQRKLNIL